MTIVTTATSSGPYAAVAQTTFAVTFQSASASEIIVTLNGATVTDYVFTRDADGTGQIVFTSAKTGTVLITSNPSFAQPTEFQRFGAFFPDLMNAPLDKAAIRDLKIKADLSVVEATALAALANADAAMIAAGITAGFSLVAVPVSSRAALAAVNTSSAVAYLYEAGREGLFAFDSANHTSQVTADPLQGLYVAPAASPTGSGGAWVRKYDGPALAKWWGITLNSQAAAATNLAAWNACRSLVKYRQMPALGTFWVSAPFRIDDGYSTTLFPQYSDGYGDATGCRVLSTDTTLDAAVIGPDVAPAGGVANYIRNVVVKNLCAGWGVAHAALSGPDVDLATAIRINYLLDPYIEYPWAHEAPIGFQYYAVVGGEVRRPKAFRSAALGGNVPTDKFFGHWVKGSPAILAGGNPSLEITDAIVEQGNASPFSDECGMVFEGAFSDVHVTKLETSNCKNPLRITGMSASGATVAEKLAGNINFELDELIMDTFDGIAVDVQNVADGGKVTIGRINAMSAVGATYGVRLLNNLGHVHIDGQVFGKGASASGGTMRGLYIENSPNVSGVVTLVDCPRPVEGLTATMCNLDVTVHNPSVVSNPTQAAVLLTTSSRGTIRARVSGMAGAFSAGINATGSGNNNLTFLGMEAVNPACITGGAANKLLINAVSITAPGQYTNLGVANAAGTMTVVGSML